MADSGPSADYSRQTQPGTGHQPSSYTPVEYPAYPSLIPQPASQPAPASHDLAGYGYQPAPQQDSAGYGYAPAPQQDPYAHFQQQQQHPEQVPSHSGVSTGTTAWDSPGYHQQQQQSHFEATPQVSTGLMPNPYSSPGHGMRSATLVQNSALNKPKPNFAIQICM